MARNLTLKYMKRWMPFRGNEWCLCGLLKSWLVYVLSGRGKEPDIEVHEALDAVQRK